MEYQSKLFKYRTIDLLRGHNNKSNHYDIFMFFLLQNEKDNFVKANKLKALADSAVVKSGDLKKRQK